MSILRKHMKSAASAALMALVFTGNVLAADLSSAKADGLIGEKPDGYLGLVVSSAPADVRALVDEVNAKRRANYQKIARETDAPVDEVEKVGGIKAIEKTKAGHFVMDDSGRWLRK